MQYYFLGCMAVLRTNGRCLTVVNAMRDMPVKATLDTTSSPVEPECQPYIINAMTALHFIWSTYITLMYQISCLPDHVASLAGPPHVHVQRPFCSICNRTSAV